MRSLTSALCVLTATTTLCATAARAEMLPADVAAQAASATPIGELPANQNMTIALLLPLGDSAGLDARLNHIYTPGDRLYHHFMTPADFAASFGASRRGYDAAIAWATSNGLAVGEASSSRTVLTVSGTAAQMQTAFGVKLLQYREANGRVYFSADRAPAMPDALRGVVNGAVGFSNYSGTPTLLRVKPAGVAARAAGSGPAGGYSAADLRTAYAIQLQPPSTDRETLAVFEYGGFYGSDVARYKHENKLPDVPVSVRRVNGYNGAVNDPSVELEAVLDIDMAIAINPSAARILVYEDGSDTFGVALLASLNAMASDATAQTISISYGTDEVIQGRTQIFAEDVLFRQLAAQGQAVFVASGDQGAYGRTGQGLNVSDPASQPYVTGVGGTTLFTGPGGSYLGEQAWNLLGLQLGATGGGVSSIWHIPHYQSEIPRGPSIGTNGASPTHRNVPDVAAVGDPLTGVSIYSAINGGWQVIGGTSVSAPIWAGIYSILNEVNKGLGLGPIGFFNPGFYGEQVNNRIINAQTHDVYDGSNGNAAIYGIPGYDAGPGYDDTTGLGTPSGALLIPSYAYNGYNFGGHPPRKATDFHVTTTADTATLSWTPAPGSNTYVSITSQIDTFSPTLPYSPFLITKGNEVTVRHLSPNTTYYFELQDENGKGVNAVRPISAATMPR